MIKHIKYNTLFFHRFQGLIKIYYKENFAKINAKKIKYIIYYKIADRIYY